MQMQSKVKKMCQQDTYIMNNRSRETYPTMVKQQQQQQPLLAFASFS